MPSKNPIIKKAFKDGKITKGQYYKLGDALLLGIIRKKPKGGTKKGRQPAGSSGGEKGAGVGLAPKPALQPHQTKYSGTKKGQVRKTARKAYEPKGGVTKGSVTRKVGTKGKGTKEVRHKIGKEAHKRGRPKGGSKVEVKK